MNIYEYGREHPKKFLLIASAGLEPYWAFADPINLLAQEFHVYAVAADGHDPEEPSDFLSVEKTVEDMTEELHRRSVKNFYGGYGLSMGGSVLARFLATADIPVEKAVLDAGIFPYSYPKLFCKMILMKDFLLMRSIVRHRKILEFVAPPERWTPEGHDPKEEYDRLEEFYKTYSDRTIKNVFRSANNYELPHPAPDIRTKIEYWYGEREKKARRKDLTYVQNYFKDLQFREIPGKNHGELVMVYPKEWFGELMKFMGE